MNNLLFFKKIVLFNFENLKRIKVIEDLHQEREINHEMSFDSVRGVFFEGDQIYNTSGF
jgi:hypothetical protein